jgi:SAM-dependent methyltransferase
VALRFTNWNHSGMAIIDEEDLPYGENFHDEQEAAAWADAAIRKRPWRPMIFDHFVRVLNGSKLLSPRILELGSGPGFLAEHVLDRCPSISRYTLLDFSEAMLALSRERLTRHQARASFVHADFKSEWWPTRCGEHSTSSFPCRPCMSSAISAMRRAYTRRSARCYLRRRRWSSAIIYPTTP